MAESLGELTRTHYCGSLREAQVGQTVIVMGWADTRRDLGGVVFIDLRDREGLCQVVARPEVSKDAHVAADKVRGEYVIAVIGEVAKRSPETINPKLPTGEVEVLAREIRILSEARTPPFPIEDQLATSEDIRLKYRYLDLRRPKLQKNLKLRHQVTMDVRRYLDGEGFLEIETPMLTKSTPEGARDFLVPSRTHHGSFYALPQSPQLFKQILMVAGMDRYFQIVRCFRDEDLRADRQPEFTQVDIEMSFPRMETVFGLVEAPFQRMAYAEVIERYGSDKPDLRFAMPITDVTDEMTVLGLDTYPGLIADGARCRAIVLPATGGVSGTRLRKINEELWLGRIVPDARGSKRALLTLKASDETIAKLAEKGVKADVAKQLFAKAGAGKDDMVLIGTDAVGPLAQAMGVLRLEMGRELKLVDRYHSVLSLIFIDLDRFKPINDTWGHLRGSRVLREVGFLLRSAVRETDYPARYGGDEFVVILPQTDGESAQRLAEKLRELVETHVFLQEEGINARIGVSLGVASYPTDARTKEALVRLADERMYADKQQRK